MCVSAIKSFAYTLARNGGAAAAVRATARGAGGSAARAR